MNSVKTTLKNSVLNITFQGGLQTKNMSAVKAKIINRLDKSPKKAIIKLDNYEKLDFSFIQLLVSFQAYLENKQIPYSLNLNFSVEDKDLLDKLGVINIFKNKKGSNESISS